ncbi:gliding motility lipoprotein GldH [Pedobacter changchengzhani]|uniref:Gliding motility lipoprotein GldH n=1 Tax=Pedobacter changchengzhani TaxID=2529274 RepID=A0A4R5MQ80_9SPHI|nr:gliding motility lipoprotein GldH [Pedobacter changchengzhani]TDG37535.1 gliding motility lipoprotein GldH [Pedobacter changchengzhani]
MVQKLSLLASKKAALLVGIFFAISLLSSCASNIADVNVEIPDHAWSYRNHIKASFEIKDYTKAYNIYFKLRHTADYRYANIFILAHFKNDKSTATKRFEFKLAKNDGEWLGSGSGNLFTYNLPLLSNYHFEKNGKHEIDLEQNMRDNPLMEISDVGILVEEVK